MNSWIVAHGSGADEILIFGFTAVVVLGIRLIRRHSSDPDPEKDDPQ
jgi:hypothetical protein